MATRDPSTRESQKSRSAPPHVARFLRALPGCHLQRSSSGRALPHDAPECIQVDRRRLSATGEKLPGILKPPMTKERYTEGFKGESGAHLNRRCGPQSRVQGAPAALDLFSEDLDINRCAHPDL